MVQCCNDTLLRLALWCINVKQKTGSAIRAAGCAGHGAFGDEGQTWCTGRMTSSGLQNAEDRQHSTCPTTRDVRRGVQDARDRTRWPFAERQIGRDDDGAALVELADQLKQELTTGLNKGR